MQKKAGKDSQLAREKQEATRAIFKRQREEQESANAAAQAEIVKHEETFCIRYFVGKRLDKRRHTFERRSTQLYLDP